MQKPLIIYDGECGFCRGNLKWIRTLDWLHRLDTTPRQNNENYKNFAKAIHLALPNGKIYSGGEAIRRIWLFLPLTFILGVLFSIPPLNWILNKIYPWIAKNRHRFKIG